MSGRIDNQDPIHRQDSSTEDDCKIHQEKPVSTVERRCEVSRSAIREDYLPASRVQRKHHRVSHPRLLSGRHSAFATSGTTIVHGSIHLATCAHPLHWFDNRPRRQRDRRHRIHVLLLRKETVSRVWSCHRDLSLRGRSGISPRIPLEGGQCYGFRDNPSRRTLTSSELG